MATADRGAADPLDDIVKRRVREAAERALAEAALRQAGDHPAPPAPELDGRGGKDPVRFGDWEVNGRAVDF